MTKLLMIFAAILAGLSTTAAQSVSPIPSDEEIRKILIQRIDEAKQSVGIVVGVIEPSGRRIVSYGAVAKGDKSPLDGNTIFEIGSISKVFTSLLMADMVQRGEVVLDDPIAMYLPDGLKLPERGGRVITLKDLSTHTSGLPRLPANFSPKDPANPYADYSVEQMYQFLSGYTLTRNIGAQYEYSNLGGGLLGHVLARRAGTDYEALVRSRITAPLKMSSTAITLSPELKSRLATGHNEKLIPVSNWDLPTLPGAGAIRSTVNDLLNFLAVPLGYTASPLAPSFDRMLSVRMPTGTRGLQVALAWHIFATADLIWHNGGTGGYRSFMGYNPKTRVGVVVLSNTATNLGVDDIGTHLLDKSAPIVPPNSAIFQPPKERKEITMDPKQFDIYVGRYQATPQLLMTISREGTNFYAQLTGPGQPRASIFPESEREFFYKVVNAQLTVQVDAQGRATAVVLHQLGRDQRFTKIEGEPEQAWFGHKQNPIDPKILDTYVGKYHRLNPDSIITITNENGHLFMEVARPPRIEMFPETPRDFFLKVDDAQYSFEVDTQGRATAVVLHSNGKDQRAPQIE